MNRGRYTAVWLLGFCAFWSTAWSQQPQAVAEIAAKLLWAQPEEGHRALEQLVRRGAPAIRELCALVKAPGTGDDAGARSALQGLALTLRDDTAPAERALVSGVFVEALRGAGDPEVRAFFVAQLQWIGRDEAVPALSELVRDGRLGEPSVRALRQIGTPAALAALRGALTGAPESMLPHLVSALGSARDRDAAAAILPLAASPDRTLRQAALTALADIGAPEARTVILGAAAAENPGDRRVGIHAAALLARRLQERGMGPEALRCQGALAALPAARMPALALLVDLRGAEALEALLAAAETDDPALREAALHLAEGIPAEAVTKACCGLASASARPGVRAAVLAMLGRRRDPAAIPTVMQSFEDAEATVRAAGMEALARFGSQPALNPLVKAVAKAGADDARIAADLLTWAGGADAPTALARAFPESTPHGRTLILDLLTRRLASEHAAVAVGALGDPEAEVRKAALRALESLARSRDVPPVLQFVLQTTDAGERKAAQKVLALACGREPGAAAPVVEALKTATGEARRTLLDTASSIGGAEALDIVTADARSDSPELRTAAVKALADWPDAAAADALLALAAAEGQDERTRVLALRGYVRVVGLPGSRAPSASAAMLDRAWELARTDDERRLVLAGLGAVRDDASLKILARAMDMEAVREEAAAAAVRASCPANDKDPGLLTPAAHEALVRVRDSARTKATLDKALAHLASFPKGSDVNVALNKPVQTSIVHENDKLPPRAVNGILDRDDGWWGAGTPAWLQVDLGGPVRIDTARAVFYWDGSRYYQYRVEGSTDGKEWKVLADASANTTPSTGKGYVHAFPPAEVRHVRLNILKNSANPSCHVAEFEVYAAGKAPKAFAAAEPPAPPKPTPVQAPPLPEPDAEGTITLFNGTDLSGWMGSTNGYAVEDGTLVCLEKGGGMLLTMHRFSDFILHFDFRMPKGANNGLAIRTPAQGNPAYAGMELQIIDNEGYREVHNHELKPWQLHGSIYGCVPARTGALKPVDEWNHQEVRAVGSRITVILNGQTILDADVDALTETADGAGLEKHPGLQRRTGHIGWLGHGARVAFRNIRIKPLDPYTEGPHNVPPEGFTALFNGKDLSGWKGLLKGPHDNPEKRAALPPDQLRALQEEADANMKANWQVADEALVFGGKGRSLCTARDYGDFELYVDWKIKPNGDSGIYLRGSPQVQIWDPARWPQGSGGLYNNQKNPRDPSECADNPIGQWNRFFIRMVGEKVTVVLNGVKVVDNVTMENYWNRAIPIYPTGQIELQNHGNTLWFRNLYLRELPPE
ncbi:MAG: DUF1080 domain-containing protein [Lentisphaeria bacterium]|nr:DUF1080 domain-containing protein [Lentisphaeria bacterium]